MAAKTLTSEQLEKKQLKKEKEIFKWEKERSRPRTRYYFAYLVLIISIIYATDEIASQIGTLMKTEIANDLFGGESSNAWLEALSILIVPFQAIGLLYRPLADRWGRKKFLLINTFGMSIAMLVIFLSQNIVLYFAGACLVQFFIPHDMHVVYIMESSPSKHRARIYSSIKFLANMSVMLVPLLRKLLMENAGQWRNVYLIPAIVGIASSLIALLSARETDAFIDARLAYLRKSEEEIAAEKAKEKIANAQGGLIPALKFAMSHKQLRWLYITSAFANIGFVATTNYQVIMSYGYAQNLVESGSFKEITQTVLDSVSTGPVTAALFFFPVGCAVSQVIMGFISDSLGRKAAAITTSINCLIAFICFSMGAKMAWNPYAVGFFCGACIGSYYSTNDVLIMMIGESAPTNLRSSIMSAQFIVTAAGFVISYGVGLPLMAILGNTVTGTVAFALLVPGFIMAAIALIAKTHDTKGIDMDTVTGTEWD